MFNKLKEGKWNKKYFTNPKEEKRKRNETNTK